MQYKTVTITREVKQKSKTFKDPSFIGAEYEKIVNEHLEEGWRLLGVHPINMMKSKGCMKLCLGGILWGRYDHYQTDVFIFFRDDGTDEYTGPEYSGTDAKRRGDGFKKAGSAMMGAAKGATDFMKSKLPVQNENSGEE